MNTQTRTEHDFLGEVTIPADDLRGIHTYRAMENFSLSGRSVHPRLVHAYALVKKACARANAQSGFLPPDFAQAIEAACDEVASGMHDALFTIDALQGGAGTSTNMAVNEVVANRAEQLRAEGRESAHKSSDCGDDSGAAITPLGHVNLHQSTNDTYPTALKVALIALVREAAAAAADLQGALQKKEREFSDIVTIGRTEMREAVPMTLGSIFSAFAEAAGRDRWRTFKCEERLRVVNLGGTATGTGLAAPRKYILTVTDQLRSLTGFPLARAENLVDQTANCDSLVEVAGIFQAAAANLIKIARDIRFLSHTGELVLVALQAGSSIMPGKVNPVIPEAVIQSGMRMRVVLSLVNDAAAHGTLQINEFMPLISDAMIEALELYCAAARTLARHLETVSADRERCAQLLDTNPLTVTAFVPHLGYDRAGSLVSEWENAGRPPLREFLSGRLGDELVSRTLSAAALTSLGFVHKENPHA